MSDLSKNPWRPAKSLPNDGTHVLVWLEEPHHGCHIQTMRTGKSAVIGSLFSYDVGPVLYWRRLPNGPCMVRARTLSQREGDGS